MNHSGKNARAREVEEGQLSPLEFEWECKRRKNDVQLIFFF